MRPARAIFSVFAMLVLSSLPVTALEGDVAAADSLIAPLVETVAGPLSAIERAAYAEDASVMRALAPRSHSGHAETPEARVLAAEDDPSNLLAQFRQTGRVDLVVDGETLTIVGHEANVLGEGKFVRTRKSTPEGLVLRPVGRADTVAVVGTVLGAPDASVVLVLASTGVYGSIDRDGQRIILDPATEARGRDALPEPRDIPDTLPEPREIPGMLEDRRPPGLPGGIPSAVHIPRAPFTLIPGITGPNVNTWGDGNSYGGAAASVVLDLEPAYVNSRADWPAVVEARATEVAALFATVGIELTFTMLTTDTAFGSYFGECGDTLFDYASWLHGGNAVSHAHAHQLWTDTYHGDALGCAWPDTAYVGQTGHASTASVVDAWYSEIYANIPAHELGHTFGEENHPGLHEQVMYCTGGPMQFLESSAYEIIARFAYGGEYGDFGDGRC